MDEPARGGRGADIPEEEVRQCGQSIPLGANPGTDSQLQMVIDYAAIRAAVGLADQAKISFRDALIVVAAARAGAAVLYTEDLNDGQEILGVRISNPFAA